MCVESPRTHITQGNTNDDWCGVHWFGAVCGHSCSSTASGTSHGIKVCAVSAGNIKAPSASQCPEHSTATSQRDSRRSHINSKTDTHMTAVPVYLANRTCTSFAGLLWLCRGLLSASHDTLPVIRFHIHALQTSTRCRGRPTGIQCNRWLPNGSACTSLARGQIVLDCHLQTAKRKINTHAHTNAKQCSHATMIMRECYGG